MKRLIILLFLVIAFSYSQHFKEIFGMKEMRVARIDSSGNETYDSASVALITKTSIDGLLDSLTALNNTPIDSLTKQKMLYKFIERHIKAKKK